MQLDLPGARRAGDEHVRQRREVEHHGPARDVAPEPDLERVRAALASFDARMSPSVTSWRCLFGTSTPIALRPGIGARMRTSADGHRVRDVVAEARDPVHLHARRELELVAGDGRADGHPDEARRRRRAGAARSRGHGHPPGRAAGSAALSFPRFRTSSGGSSTRRDARPRRGRTRSGDPGATSTTVPTDDGGRRGNPDRARLVAGSTAAPAAVGLDVVERDRRLGPALVGVVAADHGHGLDADGRVGRRQLGERRRARCPTQRAPRPSAGDDAAHRDTGHEQGAEDGEADEHDRRADDAGRGRQRLRDPAAEQSAGVAQRVDRAVERRAAVGQVQRADRGEAEERQPRSRPAAAPARRLDGEEPSACGDRLRLRRARGRRPPGRGPAAEAQDRDRRRRRRAPRTGRGRRSSPKPSASAEPDRRRRRRRPGRA